MIPRPLSEARDPDLRLSEQALRRAALHAREIAARTGTAIVVEQDGELEWIRPPMPTTPMASKAVGQSVVLSVSVPKSKVD